ncbi:RDD family protein [Fredinandcohnia humi]
MDKESIFIRRGIAFLIDILLFVIVIFLGVIFILPYVALDEFRATCAVVLPLFKDSFLKRSIGKRIVGLKITNKRGEVPKYGQIILRNITLPFILMIEIIVMLVRHDIRRIGDLFAGTYVLAK